MSGPSDRADLSGGSGRGFPARWWALVLFVVWMGPVLGGAAVLRLADLGNRPMHCDEAVHAIKFGKLLERDDYVYDPREYHGPSLNFLTLPIARLASAEKLTEVTERHLRLLPAVFGIALVGLVWLVRDELGLAATIAAALLTAVSPAMVFYSRYYIQEMLLVCLTFGVIVALWRSVGGAQSGDEEAGAGGRRWIRQGFWLVVAGLSIGLMHATKETCVIALAAMVPAALVSMRALRRMGAGRLLLSGAVVALTAAGISALLFSSFLDNPRGVIDSITTYFHYLGRASGEGSVGRHVYPWDYYFRVLFWWHRPGGPVWSEASIAALALAGLVAGALGKGLHPARLAMVRFLGVYTVLMTVVYCVLPYKTPWCALGFFHGMILLAGVGATVLVRAAPGYVLKGMTIALLAAAVGHLAWQAHRASFVAYEDPHNPYVYAHTTDDVPLMARRVGEVAAWHPDGEAVHLQVVCTDDDYWPLPWYLRGFGRVGWFSGMPDGRAAPVIITQPEMEPELLRYLYEEQPPGERYLYVPGPSAGEEGAAGKGRDWQLRPHVPLRVYVRLDLWEAYQAGRADGPSS
ncbi:flippase activity-associated protein Agl23 [Planctomycetota bacterium]